MKLKKITIVVAIFIAAFVYIAGAYNSLVSQDQQVQSKWAQVETQYQRRFDLIPNLVSTAKGYMNHEHSIFKELAEARALYTGAASFTGKVEGLEKTDAALARLLAVVENYPDLKANQTMAQLMDELAGTENRVSVERMRYNNAVQSYNTQVRTFPKVFVAKTFGFDSKTYVESAREAKLAPKVEF